ncbi:AAA family ATPase [Endozoicomonas sp.]|uniref:AAA family ATPase n=1 Tax=Endozoicomonas sp. TaxID=1892382 RepID=UPI002884A297|nr:MoxR family ATPase [Endozoicomonas sp.]
MDSREQIFELERQVSRSVIGQEKVIRFLIISLLCKGNVLLEGLPGLAKTRAVRSLSKYLDSTFRRIQFTPDLLPSDVTGTEIYVGDKGSADASGCSSNNGFEFIPGPLFGNLILVDEINRAPAKVQSALLEAMEERQVTVAGTTYPLPRLFMTMATQNPVEQEGTYPLPEAQLDRFLMKIDIDYPDKDSEKAVLRLVRGEQKEEAYATSPSDRKESETLLLSQDIIFSGWQSVANIHVSEAIEQLIVDIVHATRYGSNYSEELGQWISVGASPRASISLERAARANAWLDGRDFLLPDDVFAIIKPVLGHRISLSYKALASGKKSSDIIDELLKHIVVG